MNSGNMGKMQTYCRGELLAFLLRKRAWEVKRSRFLRQSGKCPRANGSRSQYHIFIQ